MTAIRNELANATEQTVLALKELETRIGVLKNDLAWLCQGIGQPEAARVAASPVPSLLSSAGFGAFAPGFQTAFGQGLQPIQAFQSGQGIQAISPFGIPTQAIGGMAATPFGVPIAAVHPAYANLAFQQPHPQAFAAYPQAFASPFAAVASPAYGVARAQPSFAYDASLAYR